MKSKLLSLLSSKIEIKENIPLRQGDVDSVVKAFGLTQEEARKILSFSPLTWSQSKSPHQQL
jgi:hypothetical protein